jgi:quinoprotein glucose dehydrogenase
MSVVPAPGRRWPRRLLAGGALLALAGAICAPVFTQSQDRREWRDYAGAPDSSRFMPLKEITKSNVGQLAVAWTYPHAETLFNPIVARGVIYTRARNSSLVALDAATGKEIWIHEGLQGMTNRGMNYWESRDGADRRLLFAVSDYLQAIDARTGKFIRSFGTDGVVDLREGLDRDPLVVTRIQSGTPGKVFENLLILGSATGEAYFSAPGDIRAYDVITGKKVWQFHTVPRPGEFGAETWPKDARKYIGGTNTWGEISVDAQRGIAFVPTGSATFDYYGADRIGQNLFANCLIALDARTGKRLWHFQNVHHDLWDFDNVSAPQLTTIRKDGRDIDVVAMAGKTGYLYVFERATGTPIWPIEEKPVPTKTEVPGEVLWPTQPIPTNPPPFGRQTFTADDINPHILTPQEREQYRERVSKARNEGPFTPIGFNEVIHMPGNHGGSNYGSTSANPTDGTVYVTNYNVPAIMRLLKPGEQPPGRGMGAAAAGPGQSVYQQNCQVCHGPDRAGVAAVPSLVGVTTRLAPAALRQVIQSGRGQMPPFHQLSATDLEALVTYLTLADSGRGGGAGPGRGAGAPPSFPPGPVVESGPARTRPPGQGGPAGFSLAGVGDYPEGVVGPENRLVMESYGLYPDIINPPYTTLTAYDLNKGTIKWQIGLGDDLRLVSQGITGTGAAHGILVKGSVIPTATGLLFVNTADRKLRVYDADTGKSLWELSLGAFSSGSPSMFELNGRQYVLVTASSAGMRGAGAPDPRIPPATGPTGLIALALPRK